MTKDEHTLVLLSGGIDSSSVLSSCQHKDAYVSAIFIDYGQPSAKSEWNACKQISRHFGVDVRRIALGFQVESCDGEYFGRNALMILVVAGQMAVRPLRIGLGIHALSEYYDSSLLFLNHMQRLLDGYSMGSINLYAPFLSNTKAEVIHYARENNVPLHLTYSCETRNAPACSKCPSCRDRTEYYEE